MIEYDNSRQYRLFFQLTGSVIPQSLPIGIFTGSLGLGLALRRELDESVDQDESYILKSFSIQVLATVVGYLIVVRTNMALQRWMDGISDVQLMLSKWGDAYLTLVSFFSGRGGPPEMERRILLFRVRIAHWFSLMSCLAFATLRGGVCLTSLEDVPIKEMLNYDDKPPELRKSRSFAESADWSRKPKERQQAPSAVRQPIRSSLRESIRQSKAEFETDSARTSAVTQQSRKSRYVVAFDEHEEEVRFSAKSIKKSTLSNLEMGDAEGIRELDLFVLHRPTEEEVERLEATADKVNMLCLWIIQGIVLETRAKTLDAPPPIVTRVFQELSNGMLGFSQAHKVAMVPFPFPFAQMVSILLCFLYAVLPFYVDAFTKNVIITPLISFLVPICYNGLNSLAIELEAPFGSDANDVDIEGMHTEFLYQILDVLRQPMIPPAGTERGPTPEKKIARGIKKVVKEVHSRVNGKWTWDLLNLDSGDSRRAPTSDGESTMTFKLGERDDEVTDLIGSFSLRVPDEAAAHSLPSRNGVPNSRTGWKDFKERSELSQMSWAEESHLEETNKFEKLAMGSKFGLFGPNSCGVTCDSGSPPLARVIGDIDYESNGHDLQFS